MSVSCSHGPKFGMYVCCMVCYSENDERGVRCMHSRGRHWNRWNVSLSCFEALVAAILWAYITRWNCRTEKWWQECGKDSRSMLFIRNCGMLPLLHDFCILYLQWRFKMFPNVSCVFSGRSKTYGHYRHSAVNSIGHSVGGGKWVGVVSVLSPVPGLKRTGTQTPRHHYPATSR